MRQMITRKAFLLLAFLVAVIHIALVVSFGTQKEGFHEDEYYTYWSSTTEEELTVKQNYVWRIGYDLMSRYFVKEGERFSFAAVVKNQVEDVHPPLYYLTLNIFMSIFYGRFYKWFGILLNLLYSLISYAGILMFFCRLDRGRNRYLLALIAGLSFAVAPSSISNCMLTRMYAMSAMWTVIYANIFLLLIQNFDCSWRKYLKFLAAGAVTCYLAFLTHYFALVVPFGLTFFYCIYVLCERKGVVKMLVYGAGMLAAIGLAVLTYPASIQHIFYGYRGATAIGSLTSGGVWGMMELFLPILDRCVFAGWMRELMLLTGLCLVVGGALLLWRKREGLPPVSMHLFALAASVGSCVWSLWFLCRTALAVGDASCRFFYPVLVLILPLMAYIIVKLACSLPSGNWRKGLRIALGAVAVIMVILPLGLGYLQGNVLFLYRGEEEKVTFSQEYSEFPAVMIFNRDIPYRAWYAEDQLWPFQAVYYADYEHLMMDFEDERLFSAEKVVVFMDCPTDVLDKLVDVNPNLSTYTLARHDSFFYVYLLE